MDDRRLKFSVLFAAVILGKLLCYLVLNLSGMVTVSYCLYTGWAKNVHCHSDAKITTDYSL